MFYNSYGAILSFTALCCCFILNLNIRRLYKVVVSSPIRSSKTNGKRITKSLLGKLTMKESSKGISVPEHYSFLFRSSETNTIPCSRRTLPRRYFGRYGEGLFDMQNNNLWQDLRIHSEYCLMKKSSSKLRDSERVVCSSVVPSNKQPFLDWALTFPLWLNLWWILWGQVSPGRAPGR
jgi:hypothetical protein